MKITDLRCAVIGRHPIVRIVTDEGLYGLGEVEFTKPYLKPWVLHFREALLGEDPTEVTQQHVLTQLDHLRSYPFIARRLSSGRLRLHGWYYTVETGEVLFAMPGTRAFKPL